MTNDNSWVREMSRSVGKRIAITGGDVVTTDGVLTGATLVLRDGIIEGIEPRGAMTPHAEVVDASGCVVLPGLINAHAHGCTTGPLFSSAAPGLSGPIARANIGRHRDAGVTTVVNVCGLGLPEEVPAADIDVLLATTHLPSALMAADAVDGSGLTPKHRAMTAERMLSDGAVLIGEVGSGATLGGGVAAYRYIPQVILAETGIALDPGQVTSLIDALVGDSRLDEPDSERLLVAMAEVGLDEPALLVTRDAIMHFAVAPVRASLDSFAEAVRLAESMGAPAMFHAAQPSAKRLLDLARDSSATLIAGHLNHPSIPEGDVLHLARDLREAGVVIDVSSLDMITAQRLATPERADLLAEAGMVDTLSTDYAGGQWEPMLGVAERWHRRGFIDLREVALMTATRTADLLGLRDRGRLDAGARADVVVVSADDLASVRGVFVAGARVT